MVVRGTALSASTNPARASADLSVAQAEPAPARLIVPAGKLLQDWKEAHDRALAYLHALEVPPDHQEELVTLAIERALNLDPWPPNSHAIAETLRALHAV